MNALLFRIISAVVILGYMAAPAEAGRSRTHGMSFTHHTGSFTSGGFSVSHHKTRVVFGDGAFFSSRRAGDPSFRRHFFRRVIVVLNPGPVPSFRDNNPFFRGTIVPSFTIGTPINAFFVPNSFFGRNNASNFGFFSTGFGQARSNLIYSNFGPFGLTGGSGNSTVVLLGNQGPSVVPVPVPVAATPTKAQIVVLQKFPGTEKVKIFTPTATAQNNGGTTMQIAQIPAQ
jgi:hypothetical protein